MMISRPANRGFTLIEVMVALVIVALGMMAVDTQLNSYAANSVYLEDKTLASWIATNQLTELSVAPTWPAVGDQEDDVEFAGRMWHYRIEISETQVPNLRRADIDVAAAETPDRVLHHETTLIEPPPPRGFVPPRWLSVGRGAGG
jgi:general secretion pathway protein I